MLFEHKKTIRSYFLLFLQLLEYLIFIWKEDIRHNRKPSIIIPIVVYQSKKALKIKSLHDCFKGIPQELLQYIPNFRYHLTNVHDLSNDTLLGLSEGKHLRSLLLGYTFTERKKEIPKMLIEVFKFFDDKDDIEQLQFFQFMFGFLASEDRLDANDIKELFEHYLSAHQKQETVMTTYQYWVNKGEKKQAHLTVLRGRWNNLSAEILADQAELSLKKVGNLIAGYDKAYAFWLKNKGKTLKSLPAIAHLTEEEVSYLMAFFTQKQSLVSEN